jgi:hypothetical protein
MSTRIARAGFRKAGTELRLREVCLLEPAADLYFRRDADWLVEDAHSVSVFSILRDIPDTTDPFEFAGSVNWLARAEHVYRAVNPSHDLRFVDSW